MRPLFLPILPLRLNLLLLTATTQPQLHPLPRIRMSTPTLLQNAHSLLSHLLHHPDPPSSPLSRPCSPKKRDNQPCLAYKAAAVCIPHPEKAEKGGEDAWFVDRTCLGVFDGVGGWAAVGIDSGEYARELARGIREECWKGENIEQGVGKVVKNVESEGSSTACVVRVEDDGRKLRGWNIGDSGVVIVRNGGVVEKSEEQQHYFNCPYQLGADSTDDVKEGKEFVWNVREGDWVILATDGLWDNVFDRDICGIIQRDGQSVEKVADELAFKAVEVGLDSTTESPFSVNAKRAGNSFTGGKLDDVTVIVVKVQVDEKCQGGAVLTKRMMQGGVEFEIAEKKQAAKDEAKKDQKFLREHSQMHKLYERLARKMEDLLPPSEPIDDIELR